MIFPPCTLGSRPVYYLFIYYFYYFWLLLLFECYLFVLLAILANFLGMGQDGTPVSDSVPRRNSLPPPPCRPKSATLRRRTWDDARIRAYNPNFSQWNISTKQRIQVVPRAPAGKAAKQCARGVSGGGCGKPPWDMPEALRRWVCGAVPDLTGGIFPCTPKPCFFHLATLTASGAQTLLCSIAGEPKFKNITFFF